MANREDLKMWAKHYDRCINCGTVDIRHLARGLCARCYYRATEDRHQSTDRERGLASKILTKQFLEEAYLYKKLSASEIARSASCVRQYVYQKMSEYGIPLRSLGSARKLALQRRKVLYTRRDKFGKTESFVLNERTVNEDFFSSWSKEMSWVLGVVYTDGHIDPGRKEDPSRPISQTTPSMVIGQKEPELLLKVIQLMDSNAQLIANNSGCLILAINNNKIYSDLTDIGLRPKKSLNVRFPDIPKPYLNHFIRGCWDGDGSVGIYNGRFRARFFSSSLSFIEKLVDHLVAAGLPKRNIWAGYTKRNKPRYSISFGERLTARLYEFLYNDADSSCHLERKYKLFKSAYNKCQNSGVPDIN